MFRRLGHNVPKEDARQLRLEPRLCLAACWGAYTLLAHAVLGTSCAAPSEPACNQCESDRLEEVESTVLPLS